MNKRKGGIEILVPLVVVVAIVGAFWVGYDKRQEQTGGASVTDTQLSDTIGTFRTNVNSSLDSINTELETVSGTQHSYGNVATYNIPLPVAAGGTGTTTAPSDSQFLSAVGSVPTWKALAFGGGLNVTTTATSVQVNTTGLDPTQSYAWTGNNTHSGTESFNATTTAPYLAPPGVVEAYMTSTAPNGWLLCNGQQIATSSYPNLFALLGYTYGGSTSTFGLPNLLNRFLEGSSTVGNTGGSFTATGTTQTPLLNINGAGISGAGPGGGGSPVIYAPTATSSVFWNGNATSTAVPPYFTVNYIIKF